MESVPFVGCASDGQQGPRPALSRTGRTPRLPVALARQLSWYAGTDFGVLAPRGWHCFDVDGSNGSTLTVTPEPLDYSQLGGHGRLRDDAVMISRAYGGTSGRWAVANVAAGLFPIARDFVRGVRAEWLGRIRPVRLSPGDRVIARTPTRLDYVTVAGVPGLGTRWPLARSGHPVRGTLMLDPVSDMDLTDIRVRLPAWQAALSHAIVDSRRPAS